MNVSGFRLRTGILILLFIAVMVVPVAASLGNTPWPKLSYDLNNSGQSPYMGPQSNATKWVYSTDSSITYSSPAIASNGAIYIGSRDGNVTALYPDGNLKWKFTVPGCYFQSSPAISSDGTIYIADSNSKKLYAINQDGTSLWNYSTSYQISTSPTIAPDGTIYFETTPSPGILYAINPAGTFKWQFSANGALNLGVPAIGPDGTVYIEDSKKYIYAINNSTGLAKWTKSGLVYFYGSPAIDANGIIYTVGSSANLYAIYSTNGTTKWTYTLWRAFRIFIDKPKQSCCCI